MKSPLYVSFYGSRSMGQFEREMNDALKNIKSDLEKRVRRIALYTYSTLMARSPVLTGWFRSNWEIKSSGGMPDEQYVMMKWDTGTDLYITNDVAYAGRLEAGYSRQAPEGMINPTLRVVEYLVNRGSL